MGARTILVASLALALVPLTTASFGRELERRPRATAARKDAGAFPGRPIAPSRTPEEKPSSRWSGFYGGLNAGSAAGEADR